MHYKIGIFGDSYSTPFSLSFDQTVDTSNAGKAWVNLLKDDYIIDNYSYPGSSLYYSYLQFLKNYKKYDKIIFVFTLPGRISVRHPEKDNFMHLSYHHGVDLKRIMYPNDIKYYEIISDYMKFVQDFEKEDIIYKLMKEDVVRKCDNLLTLNTVDLMKITQKENAHWGINFEKQLKVNDIRHCHLCKENNIILYKTVKESIDNDAPFVINLDKFTTCNNKEDYLLTHKKSVTKVMKKWKI